MECRLLREGDAQALLGGNPIAAHDVEQAQTGTFLGVDLACPREGLVRKAKGERRWNNPSTDSCPWLDGKFSSVYPTLIGAGPGNRIHFPERLEGTSKHRPAKDSSTMRNRSAQ